MKKGLIFLGVIVVLAIIVYGMVKGAYNGMVEKEEAVTKEWADVQSAYQRRADLIPNLVATVKGYAEHEKETLEAVIEARSKATSITIDAENFDADALKKFQASQDGLTSALSRLIAVAENYPDLKANQNFLDLQAQLEGTENRINVARQKFNDTARDYNTYIRSFPQNIMAGLFNFEKKAYFEASEGADKAPEVKF
ncbi:MAG: LemA family protein [Dysgonamonadaceae bacterium]|jgi:LemA protein|nr:LemA family protein [Dysgonamonadaceae bacterium]